MKSWILYQIFYLLIINIEHVQDRLWKENNRVLERYWEFEAIYQEKVIRRSVKEIGYKRKLW